jgi:maltooligosyltrehalose trehalohydrolase
MDQHEPLRQLPIGAEVLPEGGVHFRVWAPRCKRVEVVLAGGPGYGADNPQGIELTPETPGYFSGQAAAAAVGTRYRFRLDNSEVLYPDPASRFNPTVHMALHKSSTPGSSAGPMGHGEASPWQGKSSMRCTLAP